MLKYTEDPFEFQPLWLAEAWQLSHEGPLYPVIKN
jgi:hypothetical protein